MKNLKQRILLFASFLLASVAMMAQFTVKGSVTDNEKEPAIGAMVMEKGNPKKRVVTDIDGKFTISVSKKNAILVVSYIGYDQQEIEVKGRSIIDYVLPDNSTAMKEVVIVGFATQKKINATGSVKTIDDAALKDRPTANAVQSLQGVIAGLNITNDAGGAPGSSMNINIRGVGNLGDGSNSSPLILIDGMEGDINTLNPADIENVSVLKDAAAASIYGSRAPFGVILITTKNGASGPWMYPRTCHISRQQ